MMNIKIDLGDREWFESILAMNIKIFLGDQGWFGRRRFFSSPSSGLHLRKIQGFAPSIHSKPDGRPQWEALDLNNLTESKENVNSLYIHIFVLSYL